ncbi:MAG: aldehyde dehydrogenase family protein, partial [Bacteroidetes bacterium]|nr:aldehyde dehydrogenase family protein [Bacteroidota bacterium]
MLYLANFINGKLVVPQSQAYLPSYNPATGQLHAHVPASNHLDVQAAVDAAKQAFAAWAATPAEKKSKILARIADLIEANIETLSIAESTDNGKPVWLARKVDIARAATNFRFFASGLVHFASEAHVMEQTAINYTLRKPIGIVGCISPWNLPLYLFTWKIAPALAAGNCVVAKPSEVTPFTAFLLGEICNEAGLPPGVLNIVHGDGAQCGTA